MMERITGRAVRLPRGFEWNFAAPQNAEEAGIKNLDEEYRAKKVSEPSRKSSSRRSASPMPSESSK
jgi:hypothetical protein